RHVVLLLDVLLVEACLGELHECSEEESLAQSADAVVPRFKANAMLTDRSGLARPRSPAVATCPRVMSFMPRACSSVGARRMTLCVRRWIMRFVLHESTDCARLRCPRSAPASPDFRWMSAHASCVTVLIAPCRKDGSRTRFVSSCLMGAR